MHLTLIPDDDDAPAPELDIASAKTTHESAFGNSVWSVVIRQYTPGGRKLREATDSNVTDAAGCQAVVCDEDEDDAVVVAGEIDDVNHVRTTYRLTVAETPTPLPDFFE